MYLFLNDVSGSEILVILLFILMFFGSKSIPGIARTLGRTIRQVKDATSDIQSEIKKSTEGYKKDLNLDGIFKETVEEVRQPLDQIVDDLDNSVSYHSQPTNTLQQIPTPEEVDSAVPAPTSETEKLISKETVPESSTKEENQ